MNTTVKIASFMEAFKTFLSYCDDSLDVNTITSFSELKEKKVIRHTNRTEYWCGNHHSSESYSELYMVEEPCLFFVVKYRYIEMSDNSHKSTETKVFVPNIK